MTFVLVHGAWGGGWNWELMTPLLEARGARVLAPSLVGLGDRASESSPDIELETHIDQICDLIAAHDADDVVLVGHSYGGMVITGVAARLPERVARLVYVDAFVPAPGEGPYDILPFLPHVFGSLDEGGLARPPDLGELFALSEQELAWVGDRMEPMPVRAAADAIPPYDPKLLDERDPCFVLCLQRPDFADAAAALAARGWRVVELDTHHYPMVSMPETLTAIALGEDIQQCDTTVLK